MRLRLWKGPFSLWKLTKAASIPAVIWLLAGTLVNVMDNYTTSTDPAVLGMDEVCAAHLGKSFRSWTWSNSRKVYDLVMINTELDWLEIRLNTIWDQVDYFVLVEGRKTFTGLDKPLVLKENMTKFKKYQAKIIYHEIEYPANFNPDRTWDREDLQRNAMFTQVFPRLEGPQTPAYGDVIVVADVDEIPRPRTLELLRNCQFPRRLTLFSHFYYYSFQYRHRGEDWPHPQATCYQGMFRTVRPNDLRVGLGFPLTSWWDSGEIKEAAWHCSSCFGTMDELLTKMRSFSHKWMNGDEYRDRDRIADRIRNGKDLWDREDQIYDLVENNTDVPRFLLENPDRFPYALSRNGLTAGFSDYTV